MDDDTLRFAAELVYQGINLETLGAGPVKDCSTTCPRCGHGEAFMICPAEPTGFIETCCACEFTFVDPTP